MNFTKASIAVAVFMILAGLVNLLIASGFSYAAYGSTEGPGLLFLGAGLLLGSGLTMLAIVMWWRK